MFPPSRFTFQVFGKIGEYRIIPQNALIVIYYSMVGIFYQHQLCIFAKQFECSVELDAFACWYIYVSCSVNQ